MSSTISNKTPLQTIVDWVQRDFGVTIDNSTANSIREAHKTGCLTWSPSGIRTTDHSRINIQKKD